MKYVIWDRLYGVYIEEDFDRKTFETRRDAEKYISQELTDEYDLFVSEAEERFEVEETF